MMIMASPKNHSQNLHLLEIFYVKFSKHNNLTLEQYLTSDRIL